MRKMMVLLVTPLLLCLPGCGQSVVTKHIPVPPEWLTCAPRPAAPAETTDKSVASFIVDLVEAGDDCRSKVRAIREWSQELEKTQ